MIVRDTRSPSWRAALAGALLLSLPVACGPGRTAAATQSTPAAFDVAKSDAKAIELADQMIAACGGDAAWQKAKEVRFHVVIADGENVQVNAKHIWDKWNGRHQFSTPRPKDDDLVLTYEIYGDVEFSNEGEMPSATLKELVTEARKRLWIDSYALFMVFKLKDPGVVLKYDGERADKDAPDKAAYDVIKVTFEDGVISAPGDRYWVVVKKDDHMPAWFEWAPSGKPDDYRIAYSFADWQDVGGLKLSMKRVNLGHESETITFDTVELRGEPDDEIYIKTLR